MVLRTIDELLLELQRDWSVPRRPTREGKDEPFRLACRLTRGLPVLKSEPHVPEDLLSFWRISGGAELFLDVDYGQWGLRLLSPEEAAAETARFARTRTGDARFGDLVVGTFAGDTDLLLIRCDPSAKDFGHVLVALPLDSRKDWYLAAPSLTAFMNSYVDAFGDKFWEGGG
jgi:hypothetical protein